MELEGLSCVCNGFGFAHEDENGVVKYDKSDSCLENLKDLQRYLRRDNPQSRDVFKQVCRWGVVSRDLVPLIERYHDDRDLLILAVKVLVFLTMPLDPSSENMSQQIEYLWGLKEAMSRNNVIAAINSLMEEPLEHLECDMFSEDDWKLVQLVLTLFRNLLMVQDLSVQQKASGLTTQYLCLRERFLEIIFHENVTDVVLLLIQHLNTSNSYLQSDNLLMLEIVHYILLGQKPDLVANVDPRDTEDDTNVGTSLMSLKQIMEEEEKKKKLARLKHCVLPSNLEGSFVRFTVDGSKKVQKGRPAAIPADSLMKANKAPKGPLKRIKWESENLAFPRKKILELLHNFVEQFLSGGYNILMQSVREDIEKDQYAVQNSDVMLFFQVTSFFTAYQRHKLSSSMQVKPASEVTEGTHDCPLDEGLSGTFCGVISATLNEAMFRLVLLKWHYAFDSLKQTSDYKFLAGSGSVLKEMIRMLDLVLKVFPENSSKEAHTARVLLYKIFYDQTDEGITHFLLNLMRSFDAQKQQRSDLADLVEITHIMFRLMESLQACGSLRVSKKSKRSRKRKPREEIRVVELQQEAGPANEMDHVTIHSRPVQMDDAENSDPGNLASCKQFDNQRINSVEENNPEMGGPSDIGYESGPSSDDDQNPLNEVDLNVRDIISIFANSVVVQKYCWLLKFYENNTAKTNHYIIHMLKRICEDLELYPMLFQLSILCTFYGILFDQKAAYQEGHKSVVLFIRKFIRKLLASLKSRPLLYVDILFWKTGRECHYINSGLLHEYGTLKKHTESWTEYSEKGLPRQSLADALGEDEFYNVPTKAALDQLMTSCSDGSDIPLENAGARKDVVVSPSSSAAYSGDKGHAKEGESVDHKRECFEYEHQNAPKRKKHLVFHEEEENEIRHLYEMYKGSKKCAQMIAKTLKPRMNISAAQVSSKLEELGLSVLPLEADYQAKGLLSKSFGAVGKNKNLGDSSGDRIMSRPKKRRQVFDKEEEEKIKELFQLFKTEKKCSHLIANALNSKEYSASQISRKLKQLGLYQPHGIKKRFTSPNEVSNIISDEKGGSDDETLLALAKRIKSNKDTASTVKKVSLDDDDVHHHSSDDEEPLSSLFKSATRVKHAGNVPQENNQSTTSGVDIIADDALEASREEETIDTSEAVVAEAPANTMDKIVEPSIQLVDDGEDATKGCEDGILEPQLADLEDDIDLQIYDVNDETPHNFKSRRRRSRAILDLEDDD